MPKSKLYRARAELIDRARRYAVADACKLLLQMPKAKFDETVELALKVGVDPRQSNQQLRGVVTLPHGSGKKVRVVVIAQGPEADAARQAGAEEVGADELLTRIEGGWTDFDVMIATPEAMNKVRRLGKVLGPRGLMPNPKSGTVTADTAEAVRQAKAGRVEYRVDKGACVHVPIGKLSFSQQQLADNCNAVMQAVVRAKPAAAKGTYLVTCTLSATMSPGVRLDPNQFTKGATE